MSITANENGKYQAEEDEMLYCQGEKTASIGFLLNGAIDIYLTTDDTSEAEIEGKDNCYADNIYKISSIYKSGFFAMEDFFLSEHYSLTYKSAQSSTIFVYPAINKDQLNAVVQSQKDYASLIISSMASLTAALYDALKHIEDFAQEMKNMADNLILWYWHLNDKYKFSFRPEGKAFRLLEEKYAELKEQGFSFPPEFEAEFFTRETLNELPDRLSDLLDCNKINYCSHLAEMPLEAKNLFFTSDQVVTDHHIQDISKLTYEIKRLLKSGLQSMEENFAAIYSDNSSSIYNAYLQAAPTVGKNKLQTITMAETLDYMSELINELGSVFTGEFHRTIDIDLEIIDSSIAQAKGSLESIADDAAEKPIESIDESSGYLPDILTDSLESLISYGELPTDRAALLRTNIQAFRKLEDKFSPDQDARSIRKAVTSVFFELYESISKKVQVELNDSVLYRMFLNYGYADENLLTPEQTLTLYKMADRSLKNGSGANEKKHIHLSHDWMKMIYEMEREPSISELGMDYTDNFKELRNHGDLKDSQRNEYLNDTSRRLNYEVSNMFKTTQRLCHGQLGVYFPILHKEMITRNLEQAQITPKVVMDSIQKLLEVDFSAFHRETSYRNPEKGIPFELVLKQVLPDFILVPIFGSRAIMWQDISSRNRNSPARFIIPAFTAESMDDLLIRLVGNFRWEMCKTVMGASWNDIKEKSLTSEYTDYIQFYKKNNDLSTEAKEKLKTQIQKHNNMLRELFTTDYEMWINYESNGSMRLNKVARGVLYRNCPFSKAIRENLEKQPMYAEIARQFNFQRAKQSKDLDIRYFKYLKENGSLPAELEDNMKFYKEL